MKSNEPAQFIRRKLSLIFDKLLPYALRSGSGYAA
jgi:hypothetical protein